LSGPARAAQLTFPVEVIALDAERIDSPDAQFDTVVTTFTLCTIPDALAALGEARRVLKPGGKLIFCEHGRSPDVAVQRWQDRLTPWWKPLAGGCHLNRDIPALLKAGGFTLRTLDTGYAGGPRPFTWLSSGIAQRR
jgi:ubiquinone/menaquinone biosynthesis C-methylase UbiE